MLCDTSGDDGIHRIARVALTILGLRRVETLWLIVSIFMLRVIAGILTLLFATQLLEASGEPAQSLLIVVVIGLSLQVGAIAEALVAGVAIRLAVRSWVRPSRDISFLDAMAILAVGQVIVCLGIIAMAFLLIETDGRLTFVATTIGQLDQLLWTERIQRAIWGIGVVAGMLATVAMVFLVHVKYATGLARSTAVVCLPRAAIAAGALALMRTLS